MRESGVLWENWHDEQGGGTAESEGSERSGVAGGHGALGVDSKWEVPQGDVT